MALSGYLTTRKMYVSYKHLYTMNVFVCVCVLLLCGVYFDCQFRYASVRVFAYVCVRVCMHMCVYMYVHIYVNTARLYSCISYLDIYRTETDLV